jgi:hypothetical protein
VEAIYQSYSPDQVRFFSLDFWGGTDAQCDLYQSVSGTSFPVLLDAASVGAPDQYNCSYHYCFIIDHNGLVQYRGLINPPALELVMAEAVSRLPSGVGVGDVPAPAASLGAAYPNPFNPQTRIPYEIAPAQAGSPLQLDVLNVRGQVLRTLVSGSAVAGAHEAVFDGRDARGDRLASGIYLVRLRSGQIEQTRMVTLVK